MKIWEYVDRGFRGMGKNCPGSRIRMPAFRPRDGELSRTQRDESKAIDRVRISIEHSRGYLARSQPTDDSLSGTTGVGNQCQRCVRNSLHE